MGRYYVSRILMCLCAVLSLRASLWTAAGHSGMAPVYVWSALTLLALAIHPRSIEDKT